MACTPRDPKCGRFFFIFLDFGQIPPPPHPFFASRGQPRGGGGGGRGGSTNPAAVPYCAVGKEIIPHSMDGRGYYVGDAETFQEVTADDEGSVYGDDEEEGTVVEA